MANDTLIEQSFRYTYQDMVTLVSQQIRSKFRQFSVEKIGSGKAMSASDMLGTVKARRRRSKDRSNFENTAQRTRRWLVFRDEIESGDYIDDEDVLRSVNNPQSEIIAGHMAAVQRELDDLYIGLDENGVVNNGGLLGSVVEGETPSTTVGFPSAQTIVHGGAGLTMAKLKAIREQFAWADYDLDRENPVMAITPTQMTDLLGIVDAAGSSINLAEQAQLVDGKVTRFMNMNFIESTRLPIVGTTRDCVAWMPSNLVLGVWEDINGDIWNDTHAGNTPYAQVEGRFDVTRKQDNGVIKCECTE